MEKDAMDPFRQIEYEFNQKAWNCYIKYYIALHYANEKKY